MLQHLDEGRPQHARNAGGAQQRLHPAATPLLPATPALGSRLRDRCRAHARLLLLLLLCLPLLLWLPEQLQVGLGGRGDGAGSGLRWARRGGQAIIEAMNCGAKGAGQTAPELMRLSLPVISLIVIDDDCTAPRTPAQHKPPTTHLQGVHVAGAGAERRGRRGRGAAWRGVHSGDER